MTSPLIIGFVTSIVILTWMTILFASGIIVDGVITDWKRAYVVTFAIMMIVIVGGRVFPLLFSEIASKLKRRQTGQGEEEKP